MTIIRSIRRPSNIGVKETCSSNIASYTKAFFNNAKRKRFESAYPDGEQ